MICVQKHPKGDIDTVLVQKGKKRTAHHFAEEPGKGLLRHTDQSRHLRQIDLTVEIRFYKAMYRCHTGAEFGRHIIHKTGFGQGPVFAFGQFRQHRQQLNVQVVPFQSGQFSYGSDQGFRSLFIEYYTLRSRL